LEGINSFYRMYAITKVDGNQIGEGIKYLQKANWKKITYIDLRTLIVI